MAETLKDKPFSVAGDRLTIYVSKTTKAQIEEIARTRTKIQEITKDGEPTHLYSYPSLSSLLASVINDYFEGGGR